jgi:hypothetical protein
MAIDHGCGDVDELAAGASRVVPEDLEGLLLIERMALYQDALGTLGGRRAHKFDRASVLPTQGGLIEGAPRERRSASLPRPLPAHRR